MLRVAMLLDYPLPLLAGQLGIAAGWHPGSVPMLNLIEVLAQTGEVTLDIVTTTKLLAGTRSIALSGRVRLHILGVPRFSGMPVGFLPRIRMLHQYLEKLDPDIVHGQGTECEFGIAAVTSRFPSVLTVHGILVEVHKVTKPSWNSPEHVGRWVERIALRKAQHIIAISPYVERVLSSRVRAHFHAVPNPVSPVFFEVKKNGIVPKVVFSGLIGPPKGLWDLVQAGGQLRAAGVELRWLIVGKPTVRGASYFQRCLDLAHRTLAKDRVEFIGWSTQRVFAETLKDASCLAHPSYVENFAMVIAEAMAAGTPVVAYKVGGIPDFIKDGVNGFLVPPGDLDVLAQRVKTLVLNPELATTFGERAREEAQRFRPEMVADKTLRVYERVLQKEADRRGRS